MGEVEYGVRYIHYGNDHFDPEYYNLTIRNMSHFSKPIGGLWASRVDSDYGWKQWCDKEGYDACDFSKSFEFTLKDDANIVYLFDNEDILRELPIKDVGYLPEPKQHILCHNIYYIDFETSKEMGIDAIEVMNYFPFKYSLTGWDCECILILNSEIVVPITGT